MKFRYFKAGFWVAGDNTYHVYSGFIGSGKFKYLGNIERFTSKLWNAIVPGKYEGIMFTTRKAASEFLAKESKK